MDQFKKTRQRTFQYWYVDGANEMAFGGLLILLGAYFYAQERAAAGSLLSFVLNSGFILFIIGSSIGLNALVKLFKEWVTFPRTGYVNFPPRHKRRGSRLLLAMLVSGISSIIMVIMLNYQNLVRWQPAMMGIILAAVWGYFAMRVDLLRFYLVALLSLAIGVGLSLLSIGGNLGSAIFYCLSGLVMLLSGGCAMLHYLRTTKLPQEASDEQ